MFAIGLVAALSSIAAILLESQQERPLSDDPISMLLFGCVLAFILGLGRPVHAIELGLATMSGFFISAGIDVVLNTGVHNLLPFVFAFYAIYACIGVVLVKITSLLATAVMGCLAR